MSGLRNSKIWRYRFVLYAIAIGYYGYQAYKKYTAKPTVVQTGAGYNGESVTLPDGQKAELYDVDAFMKMHGAKLDEERAKRGLPAKDAGQ